MAVIRISENGRLTLPIAARRALGITGKSKLEIIVGEQEIILRPIKSIKDVKGIFREAAEGKTTDWETIRRETMKAVAAKIAKKEFDCVEMMHQGAAHVRERLRGMTREQQLEYWRQKTEELRERQRQARESLTPS